MKHLTETLYVGFSINLSLICVFPAPRGNQTEEETFHQLPLIGGFERCSQPLQTDYPKNEYKKREQVIRVMAQTRQRQIRSGAETDNFWLKLRVDASPS